MQKQSEIKPAGWACCRICFHQTWGGECLGPGRKRGPERHSSCSLHPHTLRCPVSGETFPLGPWGESPPGFCSKAEVQLWEGRGKVVRWQNMIGLCVQKCVVPLGTDGSSLASMWHETMFLQIGLTHATRRIKHSACIHWSFIHYMWAKAPSLWHLLHCPIRLHLQNTN